MGLVLFIKRKKKNFKKTLAFKKENAIIILHVNKCRSSTTVSTYDCHSYDDGSIPFCGSRLAITTQ